MGLRSKIIYCEIEGLLRFASKWWQMRQFLAQQTYFTSSHETSFGIYYHIMFFSAFRPKPNAMPRFLKYFCLCVKQKCYDIYIIWNEVTFLSHDNWIYAQFMNFIEHIHFFICSVLLLPKVIYSQYNIVKILVNRMRRLKGKMLWHQYTDVTVSTLSTCPPDSRHCLA